MLYLLLFICGCIEDFFMTIFYKLVQKNRRTLACIVAIIRTYIWAFVLTGLVSNLESVFHLVSIYAIGNAFGVYFSMIIEPTIDKKILKLQRKGRKKKWGWLIGTSRSKG